MILARLSPLQAGDIGSVSACERQPIVQEYFERPPVCDPARIRKLSSTKRPNGLSIEVTASEMCRQQADDKDRYTYPKRAAADPEQFLDLALSSAGVIKEISTECLLQLRHPRLCLGLGQVNDDPYGTAGRQFASPTDDKLFRLSIQIAFPERKRIQCMEKLRDVVDAQLNQIAGRGFGHHVVSRLSDICE